MVAVVDSAGLEDVPWVWLEGYWDCSAVVWVVELWGSWIFMLGWVTDWGFTLALWTMFCERSWMSLCVWCRLIRWLCVAGSCWKAVVLTAKLLIICFCWFMKMFWFVSCCAAIGFEFPRNSIVASGFCL